MRKKLLLNYKGNYVKSDKLQFLQQANIQRSPRGQPSKSHSSEYIKEVDWSFERDWKLFHSVENKFKSVSNSYPAT